MHRSVAFAVVPGSIPFWTGAILLALIAFASACGGSVHATSDSDASNQTAAGHDASGALDGQGPFGEGDSSSAFDGGVEANDATEADGGAEANNATGADGGPCEILASSYDQSCAADTDCTLVSVGQYCAPRCFCGGAAINARALAQFNADVAKTPIGSGAIEAGLVCPCPPPFGPCCRSGVCQASCGFSPSDALPACADAGGYCVLAAMTRCGRPGPPDACAYSDEMCCL